MKNTAIEWLQVQIKNCPTAENLMNNIDGFLMEAKEMEKQQAERSYSEEEVLELLNKFSNRDGNHEDEQRTKKWFEQFKKK